MKYLGIIYALIIASIVAIFNLLFCILTFPFCIIFELIFWFVDFLLDNSECEHGMWLIIVNYCYDGVIKVYRKTKKYDNE